jgi:hypothetical protein
VHISNFPPLRVQRFPMSRRLHFTQLRRWCAALLLPGLVACSMSDLIGTAPLPSTVNDPSATETPTGALAAYNGTLAQFRIAFGGRRATNVGQQVGYVDLSGLLADELEDQLQVGLNNRIAVFEGLDIRILPERLDPKQDNGRDYGGVYKALHKVRGQAQQAIGMLRDFTPDGSPALRGHLYAIAGFSEVFLAEFFCSGIPLSTLDYKGDYTLSPALSTEAVFKHAQALFDTAIALSSDSAAFVALAKIGRARALLGRGVFDSAAITVADVQDGYRYVVSYSTVQGAQAGNFAWSNSANDWAYSVPDREGGNGMPYRSSGDPRTLTSTAGINQWGRQRYRPVKYNRDGATPIVLADWVEARLIEAEAALRADQPDVFLAKINHLRQTAITPALADTTDPGTLEGRVNLLFGERAAWLFLTGHRQGDLRRLIRQYQREQHNVYPSGVYPARGLSYGTDVNAPVPASEREQNSLFKGCLNRGA